MGRSPEQAAFPVTFPHIQPKTGSHLTGTWDSGASSTNGKPAGPVCWGEMTPLDLVQGCPPTIFTSCHAQPHQVTLARLLTFPSFGVHGWAWGEGPLGGARGGGPMFKG